jgi:carbonic anhydrase
MPTTPDRALHLLLEGNRRFANNQPLNINQHPAHRQTLLTSQQPFAVIFGCVDSRVPPELIFDHGLGDLLVIRTAGHAVDNTVFASLEFGVSILKVRLILVLGHDYCGALSSTIEAIHHGVTPPSYLGELLTQLRPAVELATHQPGDPLANAINANTQLTVQALSANPLWQDELEAGTLKIVGATYDLETGLVNLLPDELPSSLQEGIAQQRSEGG